MHTINQAGLRQRRVGDVVAEDFRRGGVFKRFGIDFCCGGGRTVEEACERRGVDVDDVERALLALGASGTAAAHPDARMWPLDFLADYITNVHHAYVRQTLPVLRQFTAKVAAVHGPERSELIEIARLVEEMASELEEHMLKEEEELFPYVRALVSGDPEPDHAAFPSSGSASAAIQRMEEEHDRAGALMQGIRELSGGFALPEGACNTYRASFALLEEFEDDLHRHVHLENHVLFPGTATLERQVGRTGSAPADGPGGR